MKFYYYSIKNTKDGKQYIGITINIRKRGNEHIRQLNSNNHANIHLQRAGNTDKDYFDFNIIDSKDFENEQEAYHYEWKLIQKFGNYNILQGSKINPMYTKEIKEKMIRTKQSQVENIYQLVQIDENTYEIIKKGNSMKEASRLGNFDFRNIQKSVNNGVKGNRYYGVKESELSIGKPIEIYNNYVAEVNELGVVISVAKSPRVYEKNNNGAISSIANAIKRNGKTHNRILNILRMKNIYNTNL